jgi:hypothetical protein
VVALVETFVQRRARRGQPPASREAACTLASRAETVHHQVLVLEVFAHERRDLEARSLEVVETSYVALVATAVAVLGTVELGSHLELDRQQVRRAEASAGEVEDRAVGQWRGPAERPSPDQPEPDLLRGLRVFVGPPSRLDHQDPAVHVAVGQDVRRDAVQRRQLGRRRHVDGHHTLVEARRPPDRIEQCTFRVGAPDAVPEHDILLVDGDAPHVQARPRPETVAVGGDLHGQASATIATEPVEVPAAEQSQRGPAGDRPALETHPLFDDPLLDQRIVDDRGYVEARGRPPPSRTPRCTLRRALPPGGVHANGPDHASAWRDLRPVLTHDLIAAR